MTASQQDLIIKAAKKAAQLSREDRFAYLDDVDALCVRRGFVGAQRVA